MEEKKELRKQMIEDRDSLSKNQKEAWDQRLSEGLVKTITKRQAGVVHTYLPMGSEINIFPAIEWMLKVDITVVCPQAFKKRQMLNLVLQSLDELEEGIYGTRHPASGLEFKGKFDLMIIPGLAFDRRFNRLGYGSGYYDTFLPSHPETFKLGICYPFQFQDKIPVAEHDVPMTDILLPDI